MSLRTVAIFCGVFGKAVSTNYFATDADPFLGKVVSSRAFVRDEIEFALRDSSLQGLCQEEDDTLDTRVDAMVEKFRPVYSALPKNAHNRLASSGVRYLLHRHFLRQHAWLVHGLAPSGGAWNESFPMETLAVWAPVELQTIVADHLNGRGMKIREVAVLAIMLENRVHVEAVDILQAIWRAHGLRPDENISSSLMAKIVAEHAWYHIEFPLPDDSRLQTLTLNDIKRAQAETIFPGWSRTQELLTEIQKSVTHDAAEKELSFAVGEQIVMRFIRHFGLSQDVECKQLKQDLINIESSRKGRVDLRVFHAHTQNQQGVGFIETADYLRQNGALDESTESQYVIIPNYINGPNNAIYHGRHFSVGCLDECEDLLRRIERHINGPVASVGDLISIVHEAREPLESAHVNRLHELAELHGGVVPLHGRLFALWMHHAFPHDCPYPSVAGTTRPLVPDEYGAQAHVNWMLSDSELLQVAEAVADMPPAKPASEALPWDLEEDLLVGYQHTDFKDTLPILIAGAVSCVLLLGSLVVAKCRSKSAAADPSRLLDGPAAQGDSEPSEIAS